MRADFTPWGISHLGDLRSTWVCVHAAAAGWDRVFAYGDAAGTGKVVFGDLAARHFVMAADEFGQHAVLSRLGALAVIIHRNST
jgi:hypothetical protein